MTPADRLEELEKRKQKLEAMKREREAKKGEYSFSSTLAVKPSSINLEVKRSSNRSSLTRNQISPRAVFTDGSAKTPTAEAIALTSTYDDILRSALEGDVNQIKQLDYEQQKKQHIAQKMKQLKVFALQEWIVDVAPKKRDTLDRDTQTTETFTETAPEKEIIQSPKQESELAELNLPIEEESNSVSAVEQHGPEYFDFVKKTGRLVERILNQPYDPLVDYAEDQLQKPSRDDRSRDKISHECSFIDNRWSKNRAVTSIDWSTKHPELFLGAYNQNESANEPEGVVLLWNTYLPNAPEFIFTCETAISCATFYRYHPNIVIGGTYSGQIVVWDTRENKHPVQRTPINTRSHTHPIFGMRIVGSENSHNLITMDSNGKLCSWNLSRPSVDVPCRLNYPPDGMNLTVQTLSTPAPTTPDSTSMHSPQIIEEETSQDSFVSRPLTHSIAFPIDVDGQYLIGTETGSVYSGNYIDGLQSHYGLGHTAPVTGIDCHHYNRFSDLFLTSSIDYTCKLWSTKNTHPLYSFDYEDCVYDIKWSPTHPALFASVDGSGYLSVWNINRDTEVPQRSIQVCKHALNKLAFSQDGRRIVSGSIEGELQLFRLDDEWSGQVDNDESTLLERQLMFQ